MNPLDTVFANLDRWRNFPGYQLERRTDIFFSVYLKGLLEEVTGTPLEEEMIPELPVKLNLVWAERLGNKSVKVDYALFAKDRSRVYFIELKTHGGSRRDAQDHYLATSERLGFRAIVGGFCSILLETKAHQKYHHLTAALARLGYLTLPADLAAHIYPQPKRGLTERLRAIQVSALESSVEVLYVQPNPTEGVRSIDFAQFAEFVGRHDDPLSKVFATHLLSWLALAGSREP